MQPLVGVIMGSRSDWETMVHAVETLKALAVPHEVRVVPAQRTPGPHATDAPRVSSTPQQGAS